MKKTFVLVLLFLVIQAAAAYGATTEELMHNSLAKGYLAVKEANKKEAENNFNNAFKYAVKIENWGGMLDSGKGLLVLGNQDKAVEFFNKAEGLIKKQKDWRGAIALAYVHFSMPKRFMNESKVLLSFENAGAYAAEQKDWRGLIEVAKGFIKLGARERLLAALDSAYKIAKENKSLEGLKEIAGYYKEAGQVDKSQEAVRLFDELDDEYEEIASLPQGWEPVGETVKGPEKISAEVQAREAEKADREIKEKREYLAKLARQDEEKEGYYSDYNYYYNYPYYYQYYSDTTLTTALPLNWLSRWADYNLVHYNYFNDSFIYVGW